MWVKLSREGSEQPTYRRQSRAQDLLGEDAFPGFFHREGVLLGGRTLSNLARRLLRHLDLFQLRLGDRRLRGLHDCRLGGGRHSDQRTEMQARLEPPGRS